MLQLLLTMAAFYGMMVIGVMIEHIWPLERDPSARDVRVSYFIGGVMWAVTAAAGPLAAASAVLIVNAVGTGWITLAGDGWLFVPSLLLYLLTQDLLEYWLHRAQHKVPFLWAMHSLHHS